MVFSRSELTKIVHSDRENRTMHIDHKDDKVYFMDRLEAVGHRPQWVIHRVSMENKCLEELFRYNAHQCTMQREREDIQIGRGYLSESCYKCRELTVFNLDKQVREWSMKISSPFRVSMINSRMMLVIQETIATVYTLKDGFKDFSIPLPDVFCQLTMAWSERYFVLSYHVVKDKQVTFFVRDTLKNKTRVSSTSTEEREGQLLTF